MTSPPFLERLLTAEPPLRVTSPRSLRSFLLSEPTDDTIALAALAGHGADRLGWSFAGGYEAALRRLDPTIPRGRLTALCATEEGGGHPRAIRTRLEQVAGNRWKLTGTKMFVTLGAEAELLLVVAVLRDLVAGHPQLRVARVPSHRSGVTIRPASELPFAPEITHAAVTFDAVELDESEIIRGDGYSDFLKPFRTIEDLHVLASTLGFALCIARSSSWGQGWMEEAAALLMLLKTLNGEPPLGPTTHIALAGAFTAARRLLAAAPWDKVEPSCRTLWERDRPLLDVASKVREARRQAAWQSLH
jgi:hypothetical protein